MLYRRVGAGCITRRGAGRGQQVAAAVGRGDGHRPEAAAKFSIKTTGKPCPYCKKSVGNLSRHLNVCKKKLAVEKARLPDKGKVMETEVPKMFDAGGKKVMEGYALFLQKSELRF